MAMELRTLGPVEVWVAGRPVPVPSRQLRTVLAALLLDQRRRVSAERLIELIWDTEPPPAAGLQVQVLISRLRRILAADGEAGPKITHRGGYYELHLGNSTTDVDIYLAAAESGRRAIGDGDMVAAQVALRRAVDVWRGQPLADVTEGLRRLEEHRLREMHLASMADLLQARLEGGGHAALVPSLQRLLAEHPTRERIAALLITALARGGRLAEASDVYDAMRHRLAAEFGIEPGADLAGAYQSALRSRSGDAARRVSRGPALLPVRPVFFIGRRASLAHLQAQFDRVDFASPRRVLITGLAGVGKTALALEWAYRSEDRFPDGRIHVDMHGYDVHRAPLGAVEAVARALTALGVPADRIPIDEDAAVALYQDELRHRSTLLLLDNAHGSAQVRRLLPTGAECFTIITSREHMSGLVAREGLAIVRLGPLSVDAATQLVADVSGRAADAHVQVLAKQCGYLPLALKVAAARLAIEPSLTVAAVTADFRYDDGRLAGLALDDDEANTWAALEMSYGFVSSGAARLLRFLAALPGDDLTVPAVAAAVCLGKTDAERLLGELASASLLDVVTASRYALHDLVRLFAMRQLARAAEATSAETSTHRLVDHYLHGVDLADRILRPMRQRPRTVLHFPLQESIAFADQAEALAWLDAEYRNVVACLHKAKQQGWNDAAWQLADCLYSYHLRRGRYAEWLEVDTAGLTAATACSDRVGERRIRTGIAAVLLFSQRLDDAITQLETALRLAEADGNDAAAGSIHTMMSAAYGQNQRPAECERHALAAYELNQRAGQLAGAVTCLLNAGLAQCDMGRYDDAVRTLENALDQARRHLSEEQEFADVLANLATAYLGSGRTAEAKTTAAEAIAVARRREHTMCEAEALVILGRTIRYTDPIGARAHLRRAVDLFRELGQPTADHVEDELATWL